MTAAARVDWFTTHVSPGEVRRRSVRGAVATFARRIATQGVQFASMVVLARLLTPAETGLFAMAGAITGFAALLAELQLTTVTVMHPGLDPARCSGLFWTRLALSVAAAAIVAGLAPACASFYGDARVAGILLALAPGLPLGALGAQHAALLQRNLRVGASVTIAVTSAIVTAGITVAAALAHLGYWALVAGSLAGALASVALQWWLCDWRPTPPRFDPGLPALLGDGVRFNVFNVLGYVAGVLGQVIIGRSFGAASTGLYKRATTLNTMLIGSLLEPLDAVAAPALARLRGDPERVARYFYRITLLLVLATLPVMFLGLALPAELVRVLLGPQWEGSADVLRALALGALPAALGHAAGWVFFSIGDSRTLMRWGFVGWPALILATLLASRFGPVAIALAQSLTSAIMVLPCLHFAFRGTPIRLGALMRVLRPALVAAAVASVGALALLAALPAYAIVRLVVTMVAFLTLYALLLLTVLGQRPLLAGLLAELRRGGTGANG